VSDSLKMLRDVAVVRRLVRRTLAEQPYVRAQPPAMR
jgi:hypothetical protein